VVEAGTVVGIADIHARPLAHGVETLEDLDRLGVVIGGLRDGLADGFGHAVSFRSALKIHEESL
jgi:hypothetical protein